MNPFSTDFIFYFLGISIEKSTHHHHHHHHWLLWGPGSNPTITWYFCPHVIHIAAFNPGVYKWGSSRMWMLFIISFGMCVPLKWGLAKMLPRDLRRCKIWEQDWYWIQCPRVIILYMWLFCGGFIFANFASQSSRNFHFNIWLSIVMKTSPKPQNQAIVNIPT